MSRSLFTSALSCGCWFRPPNAFDKQYLPQIKLDAHTTILASTSSTTLRQTFHNPLDTSIDEATYTFPLYDGVSVAAFTCSIAERILTGMVKERNQARHDYETAKAEGQTAGLFEQNIAAADVFTTSIGNIPAGGKVLVEITYIGELKNDAETDSVRFTIPTVIAPRYGNQPASLSNASPEGMKITVDIILEEGTALRGIQSPSHFIAVNMGRTSVHIKNDDELFKPNLGSATLALDTTELGKDFLLVVSAKDQDTPRALLETHPAIPNQRALLATLVPKFNVANHHPEIVFVVDRSGSMQGKMHLVIDALKVFLKSLPVGLRFNICSFGSRHSFLFTKSKTYDADSLREAMNYIDPENFVANYGGTEMIGPVKDVIQQRYKDLPLEVMLMTDGEIWDQESLFKVVNEASKANTRFFTLGIGSGASSALVEGVARAGQGFSQIVLDGERIDKRIVRMLKGALSPHIKYKLEVRYAQEKSDEDGFEIIDSFDKNTNMMAAVDDATCKADSTSKTPSGKKKISLFDSKAHDAQTGPPAGKYDLLPPISVPSVLQTPHFITGLYPHSRTSVYLLLSPETNGRKPEAIILRGTTDTEELELDIKVQDIGQGETIHKLAAKKTTQELEEGRDWLTALRTADGETFQSQNEGKWDLIVEREIVRLGTMFQVAGKHCSFVAVEKNTQDGTTTTRKMSEVSQRPLTSTHRPASQKFGRSSGRMKAPAFRSAYSVQASSVQHHMQDQACMATPMNTTGASLLSTSSSGGLFGNSPSRMRRDQSDVPCAYSLEGLVVDKKVADVVGAMSPLQKMQRLISLQAFTGSWSASKHLLTIISHGAKKSLSKSGVKEVVTDVIAANSHREWTDNLSDNDYATVLAIGWLEVVMKDENDVWQMVVEKARGYLEGRVDGSDQVNMLIDDVRGLWKATA